MLAFGFPGFFKRALEKRNFKTDASGYDLGRAMMGVAEKI
jgi:hypothetical protein